MSTHENKMGEKKQKNKKSNDNEINNYISYTQNLNLKKKMMPKLRIEPFTVGFGDRRTTTTLPVLCKCPCIFMLYNHVQFIKTRF